MITGTGPQDRGTRHRQGQVRSPMTCQAPLGVCRLCYGMDLATGAGRRRHGRRHHRRPVDRRAGHAVDDAYVPHRRRRSARRRGKRHQGQARRHRQVHAVQRSYTINEGETIALAPQRRNPITATKGPDLGDVLSAQPVEVVRPEKVQIQGRRRLCQWDPHMTPILAERRPDPLRGPCRRRNVAKRRSVRRGPALRDHGTQGRFAPADRHRRPAARASRSTTFPKRPTWKSRRPKVSAGTLLAKTPREVAGTQDITGGLPRVTEIFEARSRAIRPSWPKSRDGRLGEKSRGKRPIIIRTDDKRRSNEVEHWSRTASSARPHDRQRKLATPWSMVRSCRTTSCASAAWKRCRITWLRGAERLPQPARRYRRQAHRDHRLADAAQGQGRDHGRHRPAARLGHRQVRLPRGERPPQGVRENHRKWR